MPRMKTAPLGLRALVAAVCLATTATAALAQEYYDGFEAPTTWDFAERVPTGTNNIDASAGAFYATPVAGQLPFTRFGGYKAAFPTRGFDTTVDIYLDPAVSYANDAQLDYTAAISDTAGAHERDFVFNLGFYNDGSGPGAGTDRFVVTASNNSGSSADPRNPARNPIAISAAGWYTFEHKFRENPSDSVLVVDMAIYDAAGTELGTWTLSNAADVVGVTIGGNRYGWFPTNEFGATLYFDESRKIEPVLTLEGETAGGDPIVENDAIQVSVGETFLATFTGTDPDDLDLTLQADGVPAGATFDPPAGTTANSPLVTDFEFAPTAADYGTTKNVTVRVVDVYGNEVELPFRLVVPGNLPPTVDPFTIEIEIGDGQNLVGLTTTVDDAEGADLDVTWLVEGVVVQQDNDVAPGTEVSFQQEYPLGTTEVVLEVSDGIDVTAVLATIAVDDTIGPVVVVAQDVTVPTDPGADVATNVVLTPPAVADNYDGAPTLTNDAPATFPLGVTEVTWTATDSAGNETEAIQRVTVVDEEAPVLGPADDVTVPVDSGEAFATVDLPEPNVTDNVTDDVELTNDAPAQFQVGETEVTWTATDEAGNEATVSLVVTVINQAPVADAGADVSVDSSSSAGIEVTLDGSGSSDPDDQTLTYAWAAAGVTFDDPTSATPTGIFPIGTTVAFLTVTDEAGDSSTDYVVVSVDFVGKLVIDTRTNGAATTFYVDYALGLTTYYAQIDTTGYFGTAAAYASYAQAYDDIAASISYVDDSDLATQTDVYKLYRYYQTYFSFYAAETSYYGYYFSGGSYGADAYYVNSTAAYTGLADFEE